MKWLKIKIVTSPIGLERVAEIFDEAGFASLEIEDSEEFKRTLEKTKSQWQWDFIDELLYDEKIKACSVAAYIPKNQEASRICAIIADMTEKLKESDISKDFGLLEMLITELDEEDWAENWKKYFKPLPVGKNILICPVWEDVPAEHENKIIFKIDPGMSFGTGSHETTRLCIESLEKHFTLISDSDKAAVLDLGCGSGILSIIALLLGAKTAVAVDIDPNCADIAENNAEINGIDLNKYTVYSGNLLADKKLTDLLGKNKYNIILMNIVPDVIIPLLPAAKSLLAQGGKIILSGIIGKYVPDIYSALAKNNLKAADEISENDWVCVTATDNT